MTHTVKIDGSGTRAQLTIDGHPVDVFSFTLAASATELPMLEMDLPVLDYQAETGQARVRLSVPTRDALIALGWAPPDEEAQ